MPALPLIHYRWCSFEELDRHELYALLRLRQEVFVVEQDCPYLDCDGKDQGAMHLLGSCEGELVTYARALPVGLAYPEYPAIGRVITAASVRGRGLGRPLMREAMARVWETWGPGPIKLSAQAHLQGYYGSLGFEVCGPGYDEDGIPHLPMKHPGKG